MTEPRFVRLFGCRRCGNVSYRDASEDAPEEGVQVPYPTDPCPLCGAVAWRWIALFDITMRGKLPP